MENMVTLPTILNEKERQVLLQARQTYGDVNQILVSVEELNELAAVCTKYPRYNDKNRAKQELHDKAIDEVADVIIVLDHIIAIFDLESDEISTRISGKINRLRRWMSESNSMEQTTIDRRVCESPCIGCKNNGDFQQLKIGGKCFVCSQNGFQNREPKESVDEAV